MTLLLISLFAGILSVLAPCVISLLPILIARAAEGKTLRRAIFVVVGLATSIFVFTLLLKASTSLIDVPQRTWQLISGGIIILFGISSLWPSLWEHLASTLRLQQLSSKGQQAATQKGGVYGDILLGASLGPIFSACSPTYALIVATVLPASAGKGMLYLLAFILGLSLTILTVAFFGQRVIKRLGWSLNPRGWFKRSLGILFIIIGLMICFSLDKKIEGYFVERGWFDWQINLESNLQ